MYCIIYEYSLEERHNLASQFLCGPETLAEKHNLSNKLSVRRGHSQGTEQLLQVIGKVGATGVSRVHCDEDRHVLAYSDLLADEFHGYGLAYEEIELLFD